MATPSPWTRAMAIPALGATAITLTLFIAPPLGYGAAAAIAVAGVWVNGRDARAYRTAGYSPVPSIVGGALSLAVAVGGALAVLAVTGGGPAP